METPEQYKLVGKFRRKIFTRHGEFLASGRGFSQALCHIMNKVLIIGAGGVGSVVAHKCAMVPEVFGEITLASRTVSKCEAIAAEVLQRTGRTIATCKVDADNVAETAALIRKTGATLLINVALPYQDLTLMDACLEAGCDYLDTANYEPLDVAKFEYSWQWAYQEKFLAAGRSALLGSGFDLDIYVHQGAGAYICG
jgi:saccharopine dehydrogenase (NAD+, L-lysine-forming)